MPHRYSVVLMVIATVTVLLLSLCAAPVVKEWEWNNTYRQIDSSIAPLRPTNPEAVDRKQWECAHNVLMTTFCNLNRDNTSITEMRRLRDDIQSELSEKEVTPDTLRWIWHRIGRSGPFGKQYIERFRFMPPLLPAERPWRGRGTKRDR